MYEFQKIEYSQLNARQKENYNFHKVSALLADYGFHSIRLSDDWNGADFLAIHVTDGTVLKVQLKSRITFSPDYAGKDLHICFIEGRKKVHLYNHDTLLQYYIENNKDIRETVSWKKYKTYNFPNIPSILVNSQHLQYIGDIV